jgi:hypothetical protein
MSELTRSCILHLIKADQERSIVPHKRHDYWPAYFLLIRLSTYLLIRRWPVRAFAFRELLLRRCSARWLTHGGVLRVRKELG